MIHIKTQKGKGYSYAEKANDHYHGATKINNNKGVGVTFNFPHNANVLDELTSNAQNWAKQQTAALSQELEQHRQIIRAAQLAQVTAPRQTAEIPENPWKNQS